MNIYVPFCSAKKEKERAKRTSFYLYMYEVYRLYFIQILQRVKSHDIFILLLFTHKFNVFYPKRKREHYAMTCLLTWVILLVTLLILFPTLEQCSSRSRKRILRKRVLLGLGTGLGHTMVLLFVLVYTVYCMMVMMIIPCNLNPIVSFSIIKTRSVLAVLFFWCCLFFFWKKNSLSDDVSHAARTPAKQPEMLHKFHFFRVSFSFSIFLPLV